MLYKLTTFFLLITITSCNAQNDMEWNNLVSHFPKRTLYCLDSLNSYFKKYHGTFDTIAPYDVSKHIWKNPGSGLSRARIDNKVLLIDTPYRSPIFGDPYIGQPTYPIAKIEYDSVFILLYLSESNYFWAEGYNINMHVFNKENKHISGLAFKYAPPNERVWELVYPEVIDERHFLVTNILTEQLVNPSMGSEKWMVEIREDGMLHVVWMRSNWCCEEIENTFYYEDDYVEIRSYYDYYIQDPDGYTNLREATNTRSKVLEKIPDGQVLTILDISKKWWKVKTASGKIGYVHKSRIAKKKK